MTSCVRENVLGLEVTMLIYFRHRVLRCYWGEYEPGSFIDDYEGARNISLFCDIRNSGVRLQTLWTIQTAEDVEQGENPGPINLTRFVLSGDIVMFGVFNVSLKLK